MNWRHAILVSAAMMAAAFLVFVLVGCGEQSEPGPSASPSDHEPTEVVTADGTVVPPEYVDAYLQGKALGLEIAPLADAVYRGEDPALPATYSDADFPLDHYIEDTVEKRQPFPKGSARAFYFEAGVWEHSNTLDFDAEHERQDSWKEVMDAVGEDVCTRDPCPDVAETGREGETFVLPTNWAHDPSQFAVRPKGISSGTSRWYSNLRWSGWGSERAVGEGLEHTSGCGSCPEDPGSPMPVTLIVSEPTKCKGRTFYLAVRIERPNAKPQTTRLLAEACEAEPENPFYDATVRESGMTEAELGAFFQRAVENGRMFARDYRDYATALAACSRLVSNFTSGQIVPPEVAALPTLERQVVALAALAQVAAQGCNNGVGAQLSGG